MNLTTRTILLMLTTLLMIGCASDPAPQKRDPYNDADSQRSRANQSQDELSRDTSK